LVCLQAAGPVHLGIVDFESESSQLNGFGGAQLINAVFSIFEAYQKGFWYNMGVDCSSCDLGICLV